MANHLRPMDELLQIPIVGIEDAIVVPAILANEFELKIELLDFISNNPFFGLENDDPHSHIKRFYQMTRTLKKNQVPHDVVKLILFSFSLKEKSSSNTTSHSDHSILDYEAFCFDVDHIEEKSSGSTASHSDLSLPEYESFHFDLSISFLL
nr:reverse transcriptase domain-containing protein [Tanacetum cinerariifolium]